MPSPVSVLRTGTMSSLEAFAKYLSYTCRKGGPKGHAARWAVEDSAIHRNMSSVLVTFSFMAGVLSHMAIFIRGDWDKHAPVLFYCFIVAPGILLCLSLAASSYHTAALLLQVWLYYLLSLCLSITVYRLYLHPLKRFPGTLLAKLSTLGWVKIAAVDRKWHLEVQKLHKTFGDFVRISMLLLFSRRLN